ncbi:MAG TPA: N,N-dimethylformamidase beta subunit family domain-containing protein, partial [Pirellulales bacterium]|nr:N,N-dimethylformamidase beta subunit family domain-containing protein [Pirellulales bacterium]
MSDPIDTQRRDLLKTALAGAVSSVVAAGAAADDDAIASRAVAPRQPKLIAEENAKPGDWDWQLTRIKLDKVGGFRSPAVEGYCSRQSVRAGDTLDIMVSTNPARRFEIDIFRMGYYGGAGARHMTRLGPFDGRVQPDPEIGERRLRECRWEPSTQLKIPADWPSGVYLGRLSLISESETQAPWQSWIVFIVRDDRAADVLFQCSDNTWQAYNRWPDDYSLYTSPQGALAADVDVSFDRPYGKYSQIFETPHAVGSGEFLLWEYP